MSTLRDATALAAPVGEVGHSAGTSNPRVHQRETFGMSDPRSAGVGWRRGHGGRHSRQSGPRHEVREPRIVWSLTRSAAAAVVPVALLVSSCAASARSSSIRRCRARRGPSVRGTVATSDPSSLELLLVAKAGGTPTPDDNDIVSPTNQNRWSQAESGCFTVTPAAGSSHVSGAQLQVRHPLQYGIGTGGALTPKSPESVGTGSSPEGVAVSPDGGSVYVTNEGGDSISQYDIGANGAVTPKTPATVATGDRPHAVAVSPDGNSAYVTAIEDDVVPPVRHRGRWGPHPQDASPPSAPATRRSDWRSAPTVRFVYVDGQRERSPRRRRRGRGAHPEDSGHDPRRRWRPPPVHRGA